MGKLLKAFKAGAKGFSKAIGQYTADDKKILCPHCKGNEFAEDSALLITTGMTFLNLNWTNESATTLACTCCGRIQWFIKKPKRL
ncbi:MAG: hypothetical protein GY757_47330 [bacterium]|nr:hypothetical protein [bacterium]